MVMQTKIQKLKLANMTARARIPAPAPAPAPAHKRNTIEKHKRSTETHGPQQQHRAVKSRAKEKQQAPEFGRRGCSGVRMGQAGRARRRNRRSMITMRGTGSTGKC